MFEHLDQGVQPFLYNHPPTGTLLKNCPYLWFLRCLKIFLFWK